MENIDLLKLIHDDLKAIAPAIRAKLSISGTYVETLDILSQNSKSTLIVIEWSGEDAQAEQAYVGVVEQEIAIYVAINPGLKIVSGEAIWASEDGRTLLERCNQVRDRIREICIVEDPEEQSADPDFNYRGSRQVITPQGVPLRAFRLEFRIQNAIKDPAYRHIYP